MRLIQAAVFNIDGVLMTTNGNDVVVRNDVRSLLRERERETSDSEEGEREQIDLLGYRYREIGCRLCKYRSDKASEWTDRQPPRRKPDASGGEASIASSTDLSSEESHAEQRPCLNDI